MRWFPSIGPHGACSARTASTAMLALLLASCSSEDMSLSAIQQALKERIVSAFSEELKEKGSATVDVKGNNVTISVSGKSSSIAPSKPHGGEILFSAEGANDVTFQMTARESVAEVEKFYRASFAREGLVEKDMTNVGGLFKGEWAGPDGKPRAYVYAYGDEGGRSRLAVTLVKR